MGRCDPFSYANPNEVAVTHLDLDLRVDFAQHRLAGTAVLRLRRTNPDAELILDTKDLVIHSVDGGTFTLGPRDAILGAPLRIRLEPNADRIRITYETTKRADALQWLAGPQTASGKPFLYTQSGTIHARSWIPLQDSPAVRVTYTATIHAPRGLRAVMSATRMSRHRFRMTHPIPSYLIALAVGDLAYHPFDERSGVWAERPTLAAAAYEFAETPRMLREAEALAGPYRWDRYELLVMPPSFPYGGVENAQLTFVTPSLLAGDRSLVSVVAHELAHAWSGNLVTQATWNDVWLNEGLTVYLERRIVERLYGRKRATMDAVLGRDRLLNELKELPRDDQRLLADFTGRDPDEALSSVPYEKGCLFFLMLERELGRERLDAFLRALFASHAFRSITTDELAAMLPVGAKAWIHEPGIPSDAPVPHSDALESAERAAWPNRDWSTQEWVQFLIHRTSGHLAELDAEFHLTSTRNSAILVPWLILGIREHYAPAEARLEEFLRSTGRTRLVKPLYAELLKQPDGAARATKIYCSARAGYHPVTAAALDRQISCR